MTACALCGLEVVEKLTEYEDICKFCVEVARRRRRLADQAAERRRQARPASYVDPSLRVAPHHNLSQADYDRMLEAQNGRCATCGSLPRAAYPGAKVQRLLIDHDHTCCPGLGSTCGQCIRGLLCSTCNTGLGKLGDNIEGLQRAIEYLQAYEERRA